MFTGLVSKASSVLSKLTSDDSDQSSLYTPSSFSSLSSRRRYEFLHGQCSYCSYCSPSGEEIFPEE